MVVKAVAVLVPLVKVVVPAEVRAQVDVEQLAPLVVKVALETAMELAIQTVMVNAKETAIQLVQVAPVVLVAKVALAVANLLVVQVVGLLQNRGCREWHYKKIIKCWLKIELK